MNIEVDISGQGENTNPQIDEKDIDTIFIEFEGFTLLLNDKQFEALGDQFANWFGLERKSQ